MINDMRQRRAVEDGYEIFKRAFDAGLPYSDATPLCSTRHPIKYRALASYRRKRNKKDGQMCNARSFNRYLESLGSEFLALLQDHYGNQHG